MEMKTRLLLAAAIALAAPAASANCTWEWLCNGEGTCKQMPVCDTVYDTPPPKPDSAPPSTPPLALRPFGIAKQMQGLSCEHVMRQGKSGRWYWSEACFCTDRTKAKDPSTPFANIVRCEPPWKENK
jgi:hypothetical protein